mmetsp:Transcript_27504/g.37803  ORF Transcript_27504/g.37803 Transcript_27504/m.37803 type:complete len:84 (-) Transcript_27504:132-383(-)
MITSWSLADINEVEEGFSSTFMTGVGGAMGEVLLNEDVAEDDDVAAPEERDNTSTGGTIFGDVNVVPTAAFTLFSFIPTLSAH